MKPAELIFLVLLLAAPAVAVAAPVDSGRDAREHWSFKPVTHPGLPATKNKRWPRNEVDHFILARLEQEGLRPAPEADRVTWLRRVSFDLIGLPPAPEQVVAFLKDRRGDAHERVVDELLKSPRHGERWAQHWLDVVRYADTHGFEVNTERPNAWTYRDYVIRAFNQDTPYDRFIREQIAGDALGVDAATGFLVAGPHDIVKSPDINLTLMQRQDELADMVPQPVRAFPPHARSASCRARCPPRSRQRRARAPRDGGGKSILRACVT